MDISKIEDPQKLGFNVPISYHALISEDCSNKTAHPLFFPRTQGPKDFVPINPPSFPPGRLGFEDGGYLGGRGSSGPCAQRCGAAGGGGATSAPRGGWAGGGALKSGEVTGS